MLRVESTPLDGLLVLEPQVFEDSRGFFLESFNQRTFTSETGVEATFVQDNHSGSVQGVVRGLHYQVEPDPQGKLVRCAGGRVWDVAVDIRRSSNTFGQWFGIELSPENRLQLWIPPGFAHGFTALTERADLLYKASGYYSPDCDRSIRWDDPSIGIEWPLTADATLSEKDAQAPYLADAEVFG